MRQGDAERVIHARGAAGEDVDEFLGLGAGGGSHAEQTAKIMVAYEQLIGTHKPAWSGRLTVKPERTHCTNNSNTRKLELSEMLNTR